MADKIDSNIVGLAYAEETSLKVLPGTPVWYPLEPNEFEDFGGEVTTIARNPINASRQMQKGVLSDLDADGGFSQDLTQNNLTRLMQGFFFADAREKVSSSPISGSAAAKITPASFGSGTIVLGSGEGAKVQVGDLLKVSGMTNFVNNGFMRVTAISTDTLTVSAATVVEAFPATGKVEVVGFQLADNTASIAIATDVVQLNISSGSFLNRGLNVGEWIFIGGDLAATKFSTNAPGYARIEAITASRLTLRECSWTPAIEAAATGKTIQIFAGTFLRNEKTPSLIKRRSYNIERTLGDDSGVQSEYIEGAICNEFTLNVPTAEKVTCDLSFVGINHLTRSGALGVKGGARVSQTLEDAFNSSSDIYRMRIFVHGNTPTPASLFGYAQEASFSINNNATGAKAIGVLGSFDVNIGDFQVEGEMTVYFSTVAAVAAIRANSNVGFNLIAAQQNAGIVYDIPLLSISGGRVEVQKDEPITLSLQNMAAENSFGYTLSQTNFPYLPTVAMPA
jgi:hypothetical protein